MSLSDDIKDMVNKFLTSKYDISDANVVPDKDSLTFGATAKKLWAAALFIDMRGSRQVLSDGTALQSCRVHKSFLHAASKCIRNRDGDLRSFNGDSVMAFFAGDDADVRAVKAAMNIKYVINEVVNPLLVAHDLKHLNYGIGIGRGNIHAVKSGVGGEEMHQDLIWIGWPVYHAFEYANKAKAPHHIWISKNVFDAIKKDDSMIRTDGKNMWVFEDQTFSFGEVRVYETSYHWSI
jgi:class 3 adenylate cyclase